jgi:hypothetical protein
MIVLITREEVSLIRLFMMGFFRLPDNFTGNLADALREVASYLEANNFPGGKYRVAGDLRYDVMSRNFMAGIQEGKRLTWVSGISKLMPDKYPVEWILDPPPNV